MGRTLHFLLLLLCCFLAALFVLSRGQVGAQSSLTIALDDLVDGLSNPVYLTHAGDGSGRLFVVEQAGKILAVQNGNLLSTPFLDIESRVSSGGETGLLSVAFHPNYRNNRRFFVDYTDRRPNLKTIIAEYQASTADPNMADPAERVLLTIDQPFDNHNGGQLQFGPDGYLYVGMGDGGSGGDPLGNGQNKNTLLGKILRIDVDSNFPYAVPANNPFVNASGVDEIWAFGLRNPWRFSFDRANGRLFAGDVGQNSYEEIDVIERAGDYGWNIMEATHCFSPSSGCNTAGLKLPITEYDHSLGNSVTGGYVYRGKQYPQLDGVYIFGDFGSSRIWALTQTNRETWNRVELLQSNFNISSFGEDESGEIYVVNYGGSIHRVRATSPPPSTDNRVLISSSTRSDRFTSSLFIVNRDSGINNVRVTGRDGNGTLTGTFSVSLTAGAFFRSTDILGTLQLPLGFSGPLTVESTNAKRLIAVSEVRSMDETAGFFSGLSEATASTERIIPEAVDTGERGVAGTFRTNLGVNNPGPTTLDVQVSLINSGGTVLGSTSQQVPAYGMLQVNDILRKILGARSATGVQGYLSLSSNKPFHAWASKIDNGTDDPSLETAVGDEISVSGVKLLLPSVSGTDRFKTLLVVVNRENAVNQVTFTARDSDGNVIGSVTRELAAHGFFRSTDILSDLGAPLGSFGPLVIESQNSRVLTAISEVRSSEGTAGFFPAINPAGATLERVVSEVSDTGDRGTPGTFRTNLGINNLGPVTARISMLMIDESGKAIGTLKTTVPRDGLKQINDVSRAILETSSPSGIHAYLKVGSDQPIHAWATKIDNGTDDPSLVMSDP
jgi:glucose/arabinose dehydrogenase